MTGWILALLLLAPGLPPDLEQALDAAPRAEDLPDAAAVFLCHERQIQVDAAGRVQLSLHQTIKILRDDGRAYRTILLPWTTANQDVRVQTARTVLGDRRVVDVSEVALEPEQDLPGRPDDVRRWRLSFPYVDPGAVIDWAVTITDQEPSMPDGFSDSFTLQLTDPVAVARYTVRTPADVVFDRALRGELAPPTVTRRGAWNETTWQATNLTALPDEPQRPADERLALAVIVSSTRTWADVAARYRAAATPQWAASPAMRDEARRVVAGGDPVTRLYQWVATHVRYTFGAVESGVPGIVPRPASETFTRRVGDCKDQTALLIGLLRAVGLKAVPALLRRNVAGPLVRSLPAMIQFNHVIVAVPEQGHWRWLDPTWSLGPAGYLPYDVQGVPALVVEDQGLAWAETPVEPAAANTFQRDADLTLDAEGTLAGQVTMTATGGFEQSLRSRYDLSREAVQRRLALLLNSALPTAVLTPNSVQLAPVKDLATPFRLACAFHAERYARRTGSYYLVRPAVFDQQDLPPGLVAPSRRTPVRLATAPERWVSQVRLKLPAGLKVRALPAAVARTQSFGSFRIAYKHRGDILEYGREVILTRPELLPPEVTAARAWYEDLIEADNQLVVLER